LVNLCQKTSLCPTAIILDDEVVISDRPSVENGASARVHHGLVGKTEVAVKDFRLYAKTIQSVKKVSF
jgi:hypothetical protein